MRLTPRQRASWLAHLFKSATQQHHRELASLFTPYIPKEAVVFDIGAHGGQFSKLFARMAPRGRVYAFEPSAYARSVMIPALKANRIGNVTLVSKGLSDVAGTTVLHTPIKRRGSLGYGTAHLGGGSSTSDRLDQIVTVTTLDAFVSEVGPPRLDFIKADIEGWELRALVGGAQTLARFQPTLYIEVDEACLVRAGDTPGDLFGWLATLGYAGAKATDLSGASDFAGPGDYLFRPAQKT